MGKVVFDQSNMERSAITPMPDQHRTIQHQRSNKNDSSMDEDAKMRLSTQPKFKVMDSMNVWNMREASTAFTETIIPI